MICLKCGRSAQQTERFCRQCGMPVTHSALVGNEPGYLSKRQLKDPDELTGNGIGAVIAGDGFLVVAVLLSAVASPIGSLLWLLLLIPAFFFFGKGFADVLHARQIRRQLKNESHAPTASPSAGGCLPVSTSGELGMPSITERTTRNLK